MKYLHSRAFALAALLFFCAAGSARTDKHKLPDAKPAQQYPAQDSHATENVTVAADPFDTKAKQDAFRVDYMKHGILPVRLVITNNGGKPIKLDQVRVYFIATDGEKLKSLGEEQVERRMRDLKTDPSHGMEAPFPFKRGPKLSTKDNDVAKDFNDADFADLSVAPGGTQSGVLFFDVSDYSHPLKAASLYVKQVRNDTGQDLFPFEVKFDKYLDSTQVHQ